MVRQWNKASLGEISIRITDGSHESPIEVEDGYYMPSVKDMNNQGFVYTDCKKISKFDYDKLVKNGCRPQNGDVLIAKDGSILKYAFVCDGNDEIVVLSSIAIIRPNKLIIDSYYLAHYFSQPEFVRDVVENYKSGTGVPRIVLKNFAQIPIKFPDLSEQQNIAKYLSDIDGLINSLEKLIEKKKNIRQGAMQKLITGKERLPGRIEPWVDINMSKKSRLKARIGWQGLTTAEYLDDGYSLLVTGTDFKDGHIYWNGCHYVTKERFDQDTNIQIRNDDILITKDGTIGKVAIVSGLNRPATLNSGVFVVRPFEKAYSPKFLYYVLLSDVFRDFLDKLTAGSTIVHLYQKDLVNFEFQAPSTIEEQEEIAKILSDMDEEIEMLDVKLEKTKLIKQGMMQKLLTGEIRLI